MELTLLTGVGVALFGVLVGVLSAMFGIGGGIVMVPLIHLVFGQPAAVASGTSLFAILPTSLAGMAARLRDGTIRFPVGVAAGLAGACLSPLGALAASSLPGAYAMVLTACFILFTAFNMFKRVWKTRPAALEQAEASAPSSPPSPGQGREAPLAGASGARLCLASALLGALVGFLSGYLGLGGGFLIVPLLQSVFGFTMKQATGTSLVAVAILAVPGFVAHALLGNVLWVVGLLLIAGSVVGARVGASLVKRVNERLLTGLFGLVLVVSGVILALQEIVG